MEPKISPEVQDRVSKADAYLSQQQLWKAKAILREAQALATTPDERSVVWELTGQTLRLLGQYSQAERRLRDAILASDYATRDAVLNLFMLYYATKRPWTALAAQLEALQMTPEDPQFLAKALEVIGTLYMSLGFPGYAVPHLRRALQSLKALQGHPETIKAIAQRLEKAEMVGPEGFARESYSTQLLIELRKAEHGQAEYCRCMDHLSDLHLAKGNHWMGLLCALEVLAAQPDAQLWQKHHHRAAEHWVSLGDVEFMFVHYRKLAYAAAQEKDKETLRSLTLEALQAAQPAGWTEADLARALQRLPDSPTGEFLRDIYNNLPRKNPKHKP